jgi:hypothetical protein
MAFWSLVFYPWMPFEPSNIFVLESLLFSLFNMTGLGNKGNVVISKYHTLDHPTFGGFCVVILKLFEI